ncbi:hypothetical protein ACSFC1_05765 [Pseudothermotoga sp. U03pept]|uniref:hypothetical protein n=1 Tax=Pseudothermotoga sp. U03pept TaxID=3447012 RepID=UPI003EFDDCCC
MVGRLIKNSVLFVVLLFSGLIPTILLQRQIRADFNQVNTSLLKSSAAFIEMSIERQIESAPTQADRILAKYAELAQRLGGVFLYDEELKKTIVSLRQDNSVRTVAISFDIQFDDLMYFVTDTAGRIVASSNRVLVGERSIGVVKIEKTGEIFEARYRGLNHLALAKKNLSYGFTVVVLTPSRDMSSVILPILICISLTFTVILVTVLDHHKKKLLALERDIQQLLNGSEDSFAVKDKRSPQFINELRQKLLKKDELLKKTVEELMKLKEVLEKIKQKES